MTPISGRLIGGWSTKAASDTRVVRPADRRLFDKGRLGRVDTLLPAVDAVLSEFLAERRAELDSLNPRLADAADSLDGFLAGGKRLRPGFCWWGWRAGGGRAEPADCAPVVRVAAALELIQACALLHDDLIDRSETRRGRPAMHRAQAKTHADAGWTGDPDHHGVSVALLLGDLALAWADDLFLLGAEQLQAISRAKEPWRQMRTEVLGGQLLDLLTSAAPDDDPQSQLRQAYDVIRLKTAGYTVTRPLLLGAALAGASAAVRAQLTIYGSAVGTAFQLRDDLLGVFGDPAVTGKPAGDDLREGKRTVLLARVRAALSETGTAAELAELDAGIGTVSTPAEVDRLRDIIAGTVAPQQLEQDIAELVDTAVDAVADLSTDAADGLRRWASSATDRAR